ncbi:tetratricopeptide repeat protein [Nitratireductor aquimarinus]|uniref:tetratricopeptide repeat protein n=1 Tax=Nitratireductor aquimarinus TaxID=889300 RepID=UPI001A904A5B|nr:tetratricopeptide repeat protein [Nitratireductor aquimarinus]MBN8242131.1 tetratricopeptide repeat protein [Nitratireductor aquimarinus]MBY6130517.1 tetratricopeptide repeat protein [Nitratireductor aquimarinus]MCA1302728.1 tetratricopeptide repeat protein [Nitratireductor aquimarinus]
MSDDNFIREVNEELRQDQFKSLWRRFGPVAIGAAVLLVVATAGYVGYERWTSSQANASGDAFSQALDLARQGETAEALAAFEELEGSGYGSYPLLARMRAATVLAADGDADGAVAAFDEIAADKSVTDVIADTARLRAGLILVDHGSYADVAARVETLTADGNALRHTAREALGLAAWKEGKRDDALTLFQQISGDAAAPRNTRQRAEMMVELILGSGPAE